MSPVLGLIAVIASPTLSDGGAVYLTAGAARSMASVRVTSLGAVNPILLVDTVTDTLVPVMYVAAGGTATDHVAVPETSADVPVRVVKPIATLTVTPASVPVSPEIENPAVFSAMFTVPSPAIASSVSARVGSSTSVTVIVTATVSVPPLPSSTLIVTE